jgi:hypothetical protein
MSSAKFQHMNLNLHSWIPSENQLPVMDLSNHARDIRLGIFDTADVPRSRALVHASVTCRSGGGDNGRCCPAQQRVCAAARPS